MNGRMRRTTIHWDHKVPYAYTGCNEAKNMAAACNICNCLKGSRVFESVEEARAYLEKKREAKGFCLL